MTEPKTVYLHTPVSCSGPVQVYFDEKPVELEAGAEPVFKDQLDLAKARSATTKPLTPSAPMRAAAERQGKLYLEELRKKAAEANRLKSLKAIWNQISGRKP